MQASSPTTQILGAAAIKFLRMKPGFGEVLLTEGDPGRERRAEQRARDLLRSCVNEEEWAMYRDLGFIRVLGRMAGRRTRDTEAEDGSQARAPAYAYLIYPHKPIVAYVPRSGRLLSEYCVEFPDLAGAISNSRLPDPDD